MLRIKDGIKMYHLNGWRVCIIHILPGTCRGIQSHHMSWCDSLCWDEQGVLLQVPSAWHSGKR
jgi:hypothetical protein